MAPQLVTIGVLVVAVAAFAAAVYGLNRAFNKNKIAIRESQEAMQKYQGELGQINQGISTLEGLVDEYNKLKESGEDVTEIQQQIRDQFPELATELDLQRNGWENLNSVVEEYIQLQNELAADAARGYLSESIKNQTATLEDQVDTIEKQLTRLGKADVRQMNKWSIGKSDLSDAALALVNSETSEYVNVWPIIGENGNISYGTKEEHDKQIQELTQNKDKLVNELGTVSQDVLSGISDSYADAMARGQGITSSAGKGIYRYLVEGIADSWDADKQDYSEEAKQIVIEQGNLLNQAYEDYINNPANKEENKQLLNSFFGGDLSVVSQEDLNNFDKIFYQNILNFKKNVKIG